MNTAIATDERSRVSNALSSVRRTLSALSRAGRADLATALVALGGSELTAAYRDEWAAVNQNTNQRRGERR